MKKHFTNFCIAILGLIAVPFSEIYGTTFTAVSSGTWSSSATWGGTAPSYNVISDQIIIPNGIAVVMDNDVNLSTAISSLTVNGTLSSSSTTRLTMNNGSLVGSGTITVAHIILNSASSLTFTGNMEVKKLECAILSLATTAKISVSESITVSSGVILVQTGGLIAIDSNCTLVVDGGSILSAGGNISLNKPYKVIYISSSQAGIELSGAGLTEIKIDVGTGNEVTLQSDLLVTGSIELTSGELNLNQHHLKIEGDVVAGGNGVIKSTAASDLSINTSTNLSGVIRFSGSGNTVGTLEINIAGAGANLIIGSNLTVRDTIRFINGCLNTGAFNLELDNSAVIIGAGNNAYVKTSLNGKLSIYVNDGDTIPKFYPVGNTQFYSPVYLKLNAGSSGRILSVYVEGDVWSEGTTGTSIALTKALVKNTWNILAQSSANLDMQIKVLWSASAEVNSFNRTQSYISHFVNGAWDASATASANIEAGAMFSLQRDHINSLSPFAAFDNTTMFTEERKPKALELILYPNPTENELHILQGNNPAMIGDLEIMNLTGQVISSHKLNSPDQVIYLDHLASGNYYIRLYNQEINIMKKLVRF